MTYRKVEIGVVLVIVGWLASAFVRAVQVEAKVEEHQTKLITITDKIDKISSDVSFIRGTMERKQGD